LRDALYALEPLELFDAEYDDYVNKRCSTTQT
jgi:hypothetical protein